MQSTLVARPDQWGDGGSVGGVAAKERGSVVQSQVHEGVDVGDSGEGR